MGLPERWLKYNPYGGVIKDTNILPFKVPLKKASVQSLSSEKHFTPSDLLREFPDLKYVIDLTNVDRDRYYTVTEFENHGVVHHKLKTVGRSVPKLENVKQFFQLMDECSLSCAETKGGLIGVHCTHGINRTGYLICRYLIERVGWSVKKAIKAFEDARGYRIERYVFDLERLQKITNTMSPPATRGPRGPTGPPGKHRPHSKLGPRTLGPPPVGPRPLGPPRRLYEGPFPPPPPYGLLSGPSFVRPPPPGGPIPAPPRPPIFGPRSPMYGPRMRPAVPPSLLPRPRFPNLGSSTRLPRLPPMDLVFPLAPQTRLPSPVPPSSTITPPRLSNFEICDDEDFTADTFEENLLANATTGQPRPIQSPKQIIDANYESRQE